jgi:hypothetical protein
MSATSPLTRRAVLAAGVAAAASSPAVAASPVRLMALGAERALPDRLLGFNTPANNLIPFEDPTFAPAVKALGPALMRFPGGTVSNYYNWRTGQLDIARGTDAQNVRNLFVQVAENSRKIHSKGVFWDDFQRFAAAAGAECVVLPNLETSSIDNEVARFADMMTKGTSPSLVELGNEFNHALLMDPDTLKIFPDPPTSMARMKAYRDALRPHLRKDVKIAAQAASSYLHHPPSSPPDDARTRREAQWDALLKPEPWFDAVTVHLYPSASRVVSLDAARALPATLGRIYPAMIARADEGFDRSISDTVSRVPGKEVWLTEWGGYDSAATFQGLKMSFTGMWLHQITRAMLAALRHRQVTVSNYHALFVRGDMGSVFRRDADGRYVPVNAAGVLSWFFHAARGPDAHYQRLSAAGSTRIVADGTIPGEGFRDIDAALFRQGRRRTLFVHNAGTAPREVDISGLVGAQPPLAAETVETPDLLASLQDTAPKPHTAALDGRTLSAPAVSLTRMTWSA